MQEGRTVRYHLLKESVRDVNGRGKGSFALFPLPHGIGTGYKSSKDIATHCARLLARKTGSDYAVDSVCIYLNPMNGNLIGENSPDISNEVRDYVKDTVIRGLLQLSPRLILERRVGTIIGAPGNTKILEDIRDKSLSMLLKHLQGKDI